MTFISVLLNPLFLLCQEVKEKLKMLEKHFLRILFIYVAFCKKLAQPIFPIEQEIKNQRMIYFLGLVMLDDGLSIRG